MLSVCIIYRPIMLHFIHLATKGSSLSNMERNAEMIVLFGWFKCVIKLKCKFNQDVLCSFPNVFVPIHSQSITILRLLFSANPCSSVKCILCTPYFTIIQMPLQSCNTPQQPLPPLQLTLTHLTTLPKHLTKTSAAVSLGSIPLFTSTEDNILLAVF